MSYLQTPIECEQVFSKNALGFLWEKRSELDPGQVALLDSLYKNRKKGSVEGSFVSTYRLSATGAGKLGFGRLYGTKGSMEKLERECRGTLCNQFYHDIDVINCHPVLLHQLAKREYDMDMPEVERYCDNRDEYLKLISDNRDVAKTAVITIMYGGKNDYPFLTAFAEEVRGFTKRLISNEKYKELYEYVKRQDGNIYGTFLSYVLQTEERRVMMKMREKFMDAGWSVDVLAYDGVMIRKQPMMNLTKEFLVEVEQSIEEEVGYSVKLTNKPMESYAIAEDEVEVAPKVSKEMYLEKKMLFEETHFYYTPSNTIGELKGNELIFYELQHAKTYMIQYDFRHGKAIKDKTSFIDLWLADENRREVDKIDQKPSSDPRTFSTPVIYRYTTFQEEANPQAVSLFNDLVHVIANHNEGIYEYILNWYANLIQSPFDNPKTALVLTGRKGCGKDTLGDLIQEWVVGDLYCHNYTSTDQFWEKHDCDRLNKLFVKLEEASRYVNGKHASDMKARITARTLTVNPKGKGSITSSNYVRYIMTTNEGDGIKIEDEERRFVLISCGADWVGNREKWNEIRSVLFSPSGAKAIGEWLMTRNIKSWIPTEFPENEYQKSVVDVERSSEEQFIIDGMKKEKRYSGAEFWNSYRDFCASKSLEPSPNATIFGRNLQVFIRDSKLIKGRSMGGIYYEKP